MTHLEWLYPKKLMNLMTVSIYLFLKFEGFEQDNNLFYPQLSFHEHFLSNQLLEYKIWNNLNLIA